MEFTYGRERRRRRRRSEQWLVTERGSRVGGESRKWSYFGDLLLFLSR